MNLQDKLARALRAFMDAKAWLASDSYDGIDRNGRVALETADQLAKEALAELAAQAAPPVGMGSWHFESMHAPNGETVAISIMAADKVIASAHMDGRERDYKFANDICHAHNVAIAQPPAPSTGKREGGVHELWVSFTEGVVWNVGMKREDVENGAEIVRLYREAVVESGADAKDAGEAQLYRWLKYANDDMLDLWACCKFEDRDDWIRARIAVARGEEV